MTRNVFEAYEDISPELGERIQAMGSAEQEHWRRIERRRLMSNSQLEFAGQAFGLFMAGYIFASCLMAFAEYLPRMFQGDLLRFYVF